VVSPGQRISSGDIAVVPSYAPAVTLVARLADRFRSWRNDRTNLDREVECVVCQTKITPRAAVRVGGSFACSDDCATAWFDQMAW